MGEQQPSSAQTGPRRPLIVLTILLVMVGIAGLIVGVELAAIALCAGAALAVAVPLSVVLRPSFQESERPPGSSHAPRRSRGSLGFIVNLIERDADAAAAVNREKAGTADKGGQGARRPRSR